MNNLMNNKHYTMPCAVCGNLTKVDIVRQGKCSNCGWQNSLMGEDNEDRVIYPNLVSLNKAQELYKQGKPFDPNIYEFFEAYHFYGEMQFIYKGIRYGIISACREDNEDAIDFFEINCTESQVFESDEDFIQNAKIGDEYVKDIWDQTTERYWLQ